LPASGSRIAGSQKAGLCKLALHKFLIFLAAYRPSCDPISHDRGSRQACAAVAQGKKAPAAVAQGAKAEIEIDAKGSQVTSPDRPTFHIVSAGSEKNELAKLIAAEIADGVLHHERNFTIEINVETYSAIIDRARVTLDIRMRAMHSGRRVSDHRLFGSVNLGDPPPGRSALDQRQREANS
jgi:hypothetical protein